MPVQFYFNDCLPATTSEDIYKVVRDYIVSFMRLSGTPGLNVAGWYTEAEYYLMKICSVPLSKIVEQIADRDIKQTAIGIFARAQKIDVLLESADADGSLDIYARAEFNGKEATNLLIAAKNDLISASLPLADYLKTDCLTINVSSDEHTHELKIDNWYGDNSRFIIDNYIPHPETGSLDSLVEVFGRDKKVRISKEFSNSWYYLGSRLHKSIIDRFKVALERELLFPARADDDVVKYDENGTHVYELRHKSGYRIYFECDSDIIYIGLYSSKSKPSGSDQSSDFKRAHFIISTIRK